MNLTNLRMHPRNQRTSLSHDTITDAFNRTTDHDYDPLGRLKRSIANIGGTAPERAETQFQYDALDNLTAVIDPKGLTTSYAYNGLGDLVTLTSPDTGSTTYTYDPAGNRASQTDARGVTAGYSYDALGSTPILRTLSLRSILGQRSVHVQAQALQP